MALAPWSAGLFRGPAWPDRPRAFSPPQPGPRLPHLQEPAGVRKVGPERGTGRSARGKGSWGREYSQH